MKKENKQHTPEEILNALHVIQDTCAGTYEGCRKCPLCTIINDTPICTPRDLDPANWAIDDDTDTTWRAFKK